MSSWSDLGTTGQQYIWTEEYKSLFGYPTGQLFSSFGGEVAGTSRINIFQNQIYSQTIPTTAPTSLTPYTTTTSEVFPVYKYNSNGTVYLPSGTTATTATANCGNNTTGNPGYIVKYTNVPLTCNNLTTITTTTPNQGITWWFKGADSTYSNTSDLQVQNNILNNGIPPNYAPDGSYAATITVESNPPGSYTYSSMSIGTTAMPWNWNTNSGIVMFTGETAATAGSQTNVTPQPTDTVTMTFWRYEGTIGSISGDSQWAINGNNIYNSNSGNVGIGTNTPSALLDINNGEPIITSSGGTHTTYNPFVNSTTPTNYNYYLYYSTDKTQSLTGTFSSNKNILANVLVVGAGGYAGVSGGNGDCGGGAGAVIYGSFEVQANTEYTIQSGYAPNDYVVSQPSFISLNGNNIVYAGVGNPAGVHGGDSGTPTYDQDIFTLQEESTLAIGGLAGTSSSAPVSGGNPGAGGGQGFQSNSSGASGGLCFPNNGTNNTPLLFADGQQSNILFGGGGGGGGGSVSGLAGGGGNGGGGMAGGTGYSYSPAPTAGVGGGGGGGGGFINSGPFGSFTPATAGGNATTTVSGSGGGGGIGGGGGGNGECVLTSVTPGALGPGGNGVVLIYFTTVNTSNALNVTGATSITGNLVVSGTITAGSDYRIKKEIQPLLLEDYSVDKLRPVIYKQIDTCKINMGLIAHELQEYFPFLVTGEKDGPQTQSVNYIGLIGLLIKEIQDLKGRVKELEEK